MTMKRKLSPSSAVSLRFRSFDMPVSKDVLGMEGSYVYILYKVRTDATIEYRLCRENVFIPMETELLECFKDMLHLWCFSHKSPFIYFLAQPLSDVEFDCSLIAYNRRSKSFVSFKIHEDHRSSFSGFHVHFCSLIEGENSLWVCSRGVPHSHSHRIARFELVCDSTVDGCFKFVPRPCHLVDTSGVTARFRDPLLAFVVDPKRIPLVLVMRDGRFLVYSVEVFKFEEYVCSTESDFNVKSLAEIAATWDSLPENRCVVLRSGSPGSPFSVMDRGPFIILRVRDNDRGTGEKCESKRRDILYRVSLDVGKKEYRMTQFKSISYNEPLSLNHAFNERLCTVYERFGCWQTVFMFAPPTLWNMALWTLEYDHLKRFGTPISERDVKQFVGISDRRKI